MRVGRTNPFRLRRFRTMHVLEVIPHNSKKAVFGHKGYVVSTSRWIFVVRHLLLFPRNPFHERGVEVVRALQPDLARGRRAGAKFCNTIGSVGGKLLQSIEVVAGGGTFMCDANARIGQLPPAGERSELIGLALFPRQNSTPLEGGESPGIRAHSSHAAVERRNSGPPLSGGGEEKTGGGIAPASHVMA